ncbi:MAG: hypothetical protein K940chlam3_01598 [Chlamydiae bacterium]|nr:hypothetical protein [Chlamydiota bacterium]
MARKKVSFAEMKRSFPQDITFEVLAKQFLQFSRDRYPSAEKALQNTNTILSHVNIQDPIKLVHAKIIILNVMRDAVRQVNPDYVYNSPQHRDEVFAAIIEALEGLEEELEELEEEAFFEEEEEEEEEIDLGDFSLDLDL